MRMRCLRDHGHMAWEGSISMIGDGAKAVTVTVNNVTHIVERSLQVEVYYPTPLFQYHHESVFPSCCEHTPEKLVASTVSLLLEH